MRRERERQTLLEFLPHSRPGPARPLACVRSEPRVLPRASACPSSASSVQTRASVRTNQEGQDDQLLLRTQDGFTGAQLRSAFRPALHWTRYPSPPLSLSLFLLKRSKACMWRVLLSPALFAFSLKKVQSLHVACAAVPCFVCF